MTTGRINQVAALCAGSGCREGGRGARTAVGRAVRPDFVAADAPQLTPIPPPPGPPLETSLRRRPAQGCFPGIGLGWPRLRDRGRIDVALLMRGQTLPPQRTVTAAASFLALSGNARGGLCVDTQPFANSLQTQDDGRRGARTVGHHATARTDGRPFYDSHPKGWVPAEPDGWLFLVRCSHASFQVACTSVSAAVTPAAGRVTGAMAASLQSRKARPELPIDQHPGLWLNGGGRWSSLGGKTRPPHAQVQVPLSPIQARRSLQASVPDCSVGSL